MESPLTWRGAHAHVCVVMRGWHGGWRHGQGQALGICGMQRVAVAKVWGRLKLECSCRHGAGGSGGTGGWHAVLGDEFGWRLLGLCELNGDITGELWGAACTLMGWPGVRLQELTTVVAALRQTGAVERRVRPIHLLFSIALHEEINRHHARTLIERQRRGGKCRKLTWLKQNALHYTFNLIWHIIYRFSM